MRFAVDLPINMKMRFSLFGFWRVFVLSALIETPTTVAADAAASQHYEILY